MEATSSASGRRRSALRPATRRRPSSSKDRVNSVSTNPGVIAFTVMPTLPTSRASERVNPATAAWAARQAG